ncbi:FtsX-like permease family protein [Streptomyces sp. 3MP-14]|uniref:FtsX-like permease family protein n=2 Tax=Streptomyces TaxID=1883 RepID=A0A5N6A836_9ACTN|nr:FtsX-like permease family protein [Streptomyces mimosae]KAB8175343.1 FtsX-like permease family protein [Streptomyces sp. 3MP-14]
MMLRYALQTLRARRAGFVGAFLALLCAAALVTACGTLLETGLRGDIRTERYAGTPLLVTGDQNVHHEQRKGDKVKRKAKPVSERVWLPADTVDQLARLDGVEAVVPEVTFPAVAMGENGPLDGSGPESLGHAWSSAALTPFHLTEGAAPEADDQLVIDTALAQRTGLAVGDTVTVQATATPTRYTVVGLATPGGGELTEQAALFFTEPEATRLADRPGQLAAIGVLPEPGADQAALRERLDRALDGTTLQVRAGDERGAAEFLGAADARVQLVSMGGAIGGTGLLVAVLVVVGTFTLTGQQRRAELALLRAIAATPRQIRRLIGREALLIGLVAGALGALAGMPLGRWLFDEFVGMGNVPATLRLVSSPFPPAAALLATALAAWLAARISARRTARVRPTEALAEAAVEPVAAGWFRPLAGVLALAGGAVLLAVLATLRTEPAATPVTYLTVLLLCVGVALLGPPLARAAFALLGAPLRAFRVTGHLATEHARANAARLAAVITPLTLLVAMACTILFTQTTLGEAAERQAGRGVLADWVVTAQGPGVPAEAASRLRDLPGTTAVTEVVRGTVRTPGLDKYPVQGVTAEGAATALDLGLTSGSLDDLGPETVAVSDLVADGHGLGPGDTFAVVLGDGTPVDLTVIAVYERGLGFGELTLDHALLARHLDRPLAESVLVSGEADAETLNAALADLPGLAVAAGSAVAEARAVEREANAEVAFLGMGLILAFTTIASVNTLAMATAERRREFTLLRKVGTTRRQLRAVVRLESLAVAGTAILLGTGIALATLTAFATGMTGAPAPALTPGGYLAVAGGATVLALTATAVPARLAMRRGDHHAF